jgi:hypothetical protein
MTLRRLASRGTAFFEFSGKFFNFSEKSDMVRLPKVVASACRFAV